MALKLLLLAAGAATACATLAVAQYAAGPGYTVGQPSYGAYGGDAQQVQAALAAARSGDGPRIRAAMGAISDPLARKIALWALADAAPASMTFYEADNARRTLAGWPRPVRREEAAEMLLGQSGLAPAQVIAWFVGGEPRTGQGALALANALRASGQAQAAADVVRRAWRGMVFDQQTQDAMMAGFGAVLSADDYATREDLLLYAGGGPVALDLLRTLPQPQQALAQARLAVRRGDANAYALIAALPPALQNSPGLNYERALVFEAHGEDAAARQIMTAMPATLPSQAAAEKLWKHGTLVSDALKMGDYRGAYAAAAHSGLSSGSDASEAQFFAGWIALTRLKDPRLAEEHFARVGEIGSSPITQARSFYWRGRAAEANGDPVAAQLYYSQGGRYLTTFYGQLAAIRSGQTQIVLGHDPVIGPAERAAFEASDPIRATRYLAGIGARDEFRVFCADLADIVPTLADEALLTDLARAFGDQQIGMRVVRNAAKRGLILPERGYPIRTPPSAPNAPEPAFILGIVRQESSFDPTAHSGAGARGMMQLMPATAQILARRLGYGYSAGELDDPDYNMRLGAAYLGQLVGQFSGSYVMAAAGYNAGPGRPNQWVAQCGDPRTGDPLAFIECIPFSETRDYVMRVMETTEVYRARLNGGSARLTLDTDLKRGAYGSH